ncbi:unnamed protein product [Heterobilharzia americana]|nr:unnamed protein product [Heterobilharzia americana]
MLTDYHRLLSVSRKDVSSGLWLGLIVPALLQKTGHETLTIEFSLSLLNTILFLKTNNLSKFLVIPVYLWLGYQYFPDVSTVIRPLFTLLFNFCFTCKLMSLFPFSFTLGEAILFSHLSAVFILTECKFLIPFLMLFVIERYGIIFSVRNAFLMLSILPVSFGCFWLYFCRTQISKSFIIYQVECIISLTNLILLIFWFCLFVLCVCITVFYRRSNTNYHSLLQLDFYNSSTLSSEDSHFSDQSDYYKAFDTNELNNHNSTFSLVLGNEMRFRIRKLFHFAAGIVYSSGLLYSPQLLSLASAALLVAFWCFEWMRRRGPSDISSYLGSMVDPFRDKRDSGDILMTPIALLLGLSIPLWWPQGLRSSSSDITVSIGHLCYEFDVKPTSWSGVLSIAIGDSFAALIGKAYGKRRWPGSHRTFVGSFASFLSQVVAWTGLSYYYSWRWYSGIIPLLFGVLVEAYTEQIDNLVVSLVVMLTFLISNTVANTGNLF